MRKQYRYLFIMLMLVVLSAGVLFYALHGAQTSIEHYDSILRAPGIYPDYFDLVIPPNIAPLNFLVQEAGSSYFVKIHSKQGSPIKVYSRSGKIIIPERPWHKLLNLNRGQQLSFDIYVKPGIGRWNRFHTVKIEIATENIDPVLVYRRIPPKIKIFGGDNAGFQYERCSQPGNFQSPYDRSCHCPAWT